MRSLEGKKAVVNQGLGGRESVPAMVRGVTTGTIAAPQCGLVGASLVLQTPMQLATPKIANGDSRSIYYYRETDVDILITQSRGDKQ